jgi:hypothetical protein
MSTYRVSQLARFFLVLVAAQLLPATSVVAAPVCWFGTARCWAFCQNPPPVKDAHDAARILQGWKYARLNWLDRVSGALTTQFGKCAGIQGWRRYRFDVWAEGKVYQAATSWDGLRTVDIELDNFNGESTPVALDRPRYIRAEVIPRARKRLPHRIDAGNQIWVHGEMHWDADGFLEIHPSRDGDVRFR